MARTLATIQQQIDKLQQEAEKVRAKESVGVVQRIKAGILAYKLTPEQLFTPAELAAVRQPVRAASKAEAPTRVAEKKASAAKKPASVKKQPVEKQPSAKKAAVAKKPKGAAKYQDPATGKTWTGHGGHPGWFDAAIASGATRESLLISKPEVAAPAA